MKDSSTQFVVEAHFYFLRNTVKEEIECAPAELVFGQSMSLPGQFHPLKQNSYCHQSDFGKNLREHFNCIRPSHTRKQSHISHFVDKELLHCSHVWLRNDGVKSAFQPRYSGPFEVVYRDDKVFTLKIKDSLKKYPLIV